MSYLLEQQNLSDFRFSIENSANAIEDSLQNFANLPGFDEQMMLAFGNEINVNLFKADWQTGNFTFPSIEIVSANTINGANGAFSKDTDTIYLSAEFLAANQSNLDVVHAVLLEEYGHYLDSQINSVDTPGDEGAIFSAVVRGEELTDGELQQLRNEDDSAVVMIDGENLEIEQALSVTSISPSPGTADNPTILDLNESIEIDFSYVNDTGTPVLIFAGDREVDTDSSGSSRYDDADPLTFEEQLTYGYSPSSGDDTRTIVVKSPGEISNLRLYMVPSLGGIANVLQEISIPGYYLVANSNSQPTANPDTTDSNGNPLTVNVGESILIDVLANDSDPDPNDTLNIASLDGSPFFGDATIITVNGRQQIEYTPNPNSLSAGSIFANQRDNFGYIVTDGTDTARVGAPGIIVEINQLYAEDDSISSLGLEPGDSININVLDNDFDADGDNFSLDSVDNPVFGTAQVVNNEIVYTPNGNFTGVDSFEYTIRDDRGATDTATVDIVPAFVDFDSLIIDDSEGATRDITLRRSGNLNVETTVEILPITLDEARQQFANRLSNRATIANAINTVGGGINNALEEILKNTVGFPESEVSSFALRVTRTVLKALSAVDILNSGLVQSQADTNDFNLPQTSVTFAPEEVVKTVPVEFIQDNVGEGDQFFYLRLAEPQRSLTLGVIRDNDRLFPIGINFTDPGDIFDFTVNVLAGATAGAIAGSFALGVGAIPGAVSGAFRAYVATEITEAIEDLIQRAIVEAQISEINNFANATRFNANSYGVNIGSQESETLNASEAGAEIRGFGGNDTLNGNVGNDILSGGEGEDVITGGEGSDLIEGGLGADSLSGNEGADIFEGNLAELDGDVISDFTVEDIISIDDVSFSADSLTVTQGSAILDIDSDLDGISDSTITLEGDFIDTNFDVEAVTLGEFTTTFISINNPESTNVVEGSSTVYRFFNPDAGVHFYTASEVERDAVLELPNYNFEGESYNTVDPVSGEAEDVYRFFNTNTGVHLYTTDENERDFIIENLADFAFEETAFSAYETEVEGAIPIHRFYEPSIGVHFYTPSEEERTFVEENLSNYTYEGIAYYASPLDRIV